MRMDEWSIALGRRWQQGKFDRRFEYVFRETVCSSIRESEQHTRPEYRFIPRNAGAIVDLSDVSFSKVSTDSPPVSTSGRPSSFTLETYVAYALIAHACIESVCGNRPYQAFRSLIFTTF